MYRYIPNDWNTRYPTDQQRDGAEESKKAANELRKLVVPTSNDRNDNVLYLGSGCILYYDSRVGYIIE